MNFELLNHRSEVARLAQLITNRNTYNKPMYAVDVNRWGISEPFSDAENTTIYRSTIFELAKDTFIPDDEGMYDHTHYPSAKYGSIWDY